MAETVILTADNMPTGIRTKFLNLGTIKSIGSEWAGFNELFGIIVINGRQLYYFKNGSDSTHTSRAYFETYMHIPNNFYFLTGQSLENRIAIGDNIPKENLLPIFVNNTMKTTDTNICEGLKMGYPKDTPVAITYLVQLGGATSNPVGNTSTPSKGRTTCVQPIIGANGKIVVFYSAEKIPLPDYEGIEAKYPQANGPNYYIPTLMPNLSVCFIVTPNESLVQEWVTYLNSITTAFSGAVDPEVLPIDEWKCFIVFVDSLPEENSNIGTFTMTSVDKKLKLKGTSHGSIRFIENLNLKR
jgi:hypothetical protein